MGPDYGSGYEAAAQTRFQFYPEAAGSTAAKKKKEIKDIC